MFYIDKTVLHRREALFFHVIPTFVILVAFLSATIFSWFAAREATKNDQDLQVSQYNVSVTEAIKRRMESYENVLRSGASIMTFSNAVSRDEWRSYVDTLDVDARLPGVVGIGFSEIVPPDQLVAHTERLRNEGFSDYKLFPDGTRDLYTAIIYIEPFNDVNRRILGYDMFSEPTRRATMEEASSTGRTMATDIVTLMQDQLRGTEAPGFILFTPLWQGILENPTPDRLNGFVYAPFNAQSFINNTITSNPEGFSFSISNIADDGSRQLLYESQLFAEKEARVGTVHKEEILDFFGVKWHIKTVAVQEVVPSETRNRPIITLFGGMLFSFIIAGFVYLLLSNRTRALAEKEQQGIQDAKDELLALASHQLRTPATGVKQYLGMVRQGFAGNLNEMQEKLLDKAYDSNERQLSTINEMLFVARADAGHLKMDSETIDLNVLIEELLDEQKQSIESRKQALLVDMPDQHITIRGDKPYLRMAFENLISNASKYTHESGTIKVSLTEHEDVVALQVIDDGVGVSKKDQELLFQKFSRIPNELTGRVSGSGIGLYLTKKVVDAHNGRIIFHSEANKGSEVTILLPIRQEETGDAPNLRSKSHGTSPPRPAR